MLVLSTSLYAYSSWVWNELPFVEGGVLIPLGSAIYDKFDALFIIAGYGVPSTSRPWTVQEAREELLIIDSSSLSQDAHALCYSGVC